MDIQALCGCGAKLTLTPGNPSSLGNSHGYASNNNATVEAERQAVAEAFAKWVEAHRPCAKPPAPEAPYHWPVTRLEVPEPA